MNDGTQLGEILCNKDTGGLKALHCWSRGIFFIVSAGGHIEYWQPLYRSVTIYGFVGIIRKAVLSFNNFIN